MYRLAIDPDVKASGWAVYRDLCLVACGLDNEEAYIPSPVELTVMELPQVYPQRKWKGDPNDLIAVTAAGAEFAGRVGAPVKYFKASEWKGSVPKAISHTRMRAFFLERHDPASLARLDAAERKYLKDPLLDVLDACALGLWAARKGLQP